MVVGGNEQFMVMSLFGEIDLKQIATDWEEDGCEGSRAPGENERRG